MRQRCLGIACVWKEMTCSKAMPMYIWFAFLRERNKTNLSWWYVLRLGPWTREEKMKRSKNIVCTHTIRAELWSSQIYMLKSWSLVPQNVTAFGNWDFEEVIMISEVIRWALINYDWCPYKKTELEHRHTQRRDYMKIQGEDDHLKVKEKGRKRKKKTTLLTSWAWTSSSQSCVKTNFCCFSYSVRSIY